MSSDSVSLGGERIKEARRRRWAKGEGEGLQD
jgi:hypothetical protein